MWAKRPRPIPPQRQGIIEPKLVVTAKFTIGLGKTEGAFAAHSVSTVESCARAADPLSLGAASCGAHEFLLQNPFRKNRRVQPNFGFSEFLSDKKPGFLFAEMY